MCVCEVKAVRPRIHKKYILHSEHQYAAKGFAVRSFECQLSCIGQLHQADKQTLCQSLRSVEKQMIVTESTSTEDGSGEMFIEK